MVGVSLLGPDSTSIITSHLDNIPAIGGATCSTTRVVDATSVNLNAAILSSHSITNHSQSYVASFRIPVRRATYVGPVLSESGRTLFSCSTRIFLIEERRKQDI